jgi:hypothetical protein
MVRPKLDVRQVTIAEEQQEYLPVTAALVSNPEYPTRPGRDHNSVVLAFRPSTEERARIAAGEDLYLSLLTFGGSMQPVILSVGQHETAAMYRVGVEP